jgi:type IV secretory pathway TrbD component
LLFDQLVQPMAGFGVLSWFVTQALNRLHAEALATVPVR